ncbi:thioredoxin domain-containing protein [Haloprofundus salilacus]|uniref:thioredoxin domain-containing protein n=1 Tax=Haloprofundus salilacus TaxID=2876190 RepID=UPI001CCD52A3|nr:thioredoxin domain-containing protein [Haloprofundus salilacus]
MTDPTGRNRLDEEQSPYLRQHAENPVNWQPWDDAALSAARERDVPIFLSIGYSACHWCHVMADESFEDDAVAELLNEEFIPVKVDREERPDLDGVYQSICQLVSGRGGWPLSVWLTPEGKPFFVGTYFPPESRQGMPGFLDLLRDLSRSWEDDREKIENRADQWTAAVRDELEDTPDSPGEMPDDELLGTAAQAALRSADREYGGFGSGGPKFPQPTRLGLLMQTYARTGRDQALAVVTETLDAMSTGGLYDHVGGGFHRYATDRDWTVPHFEKMLYDNAELPRVYLDAYRLTGRPRYATVAQETLAFVERELTHDEGGFYSTLDAQSEGEEGKFYVWTPEAVRDAVDDETTANLVCDRYGITERGNFENGTTVLTLSARIEELAEEYNIDEDEVEERLLDARTALYDAREERERPARDEKILAGWNGLMISAFAAGTQTLDPALAATGEAALSFVREHLWDDDEKRLSRRFKSGDVKGPGYLEDYAFLARGAFDLYQATGEVEQLSFALDLARTIEAEFWDAEEQTLYFTPESGEALVARPQERRDQSTPSSLGVAVDVLLDLDYFAPDAEFGRIAEEVLATHANRLRGSPLEHGSLVLAAEKHRRGALELTVAADKLPDDWWEVLAGRYLPATILTRRPETDAELDSWLETLGVDEAPPIWAGREAVDGNPTVYACENFTCSPPQTDIRSALDWALANEN